jgi:hypothetical protein
VDIQSRSRKYTAATTQNEDTEQNATAQNITKSGSKWDFSNVIKTLQENRLSKWYNEVK